MLKRLTSVLAVALVFGFVLAGIAAAAPDPGRLTPVGTRPYSHEMGFLKDATKNLGLAEAQLDFSQPPLGKPSAACYIDNLSNGVGHYSIGGVIYGAEVYAVFQDPAAECGGAPYTFQVWGVVFPLRAYTGLGSYTFNVRAQIYAADMTDPLCPVPGALLFEGPIVSKTAAETRTNVEANFDEWNAACVDGPYFAAINFPDNFGSGKLRVYINWGPGAGGVPFVPCASLNDYGTGWYDLGADLASIFPPPPVAGVNMLMWSYGYATPDNECHVPGVCFSPEKYYCGFPTPGALTGYVSYWTIPASWTDVLYGPGSADPNDIPSTMWFTRFSNTTPCTLLRAQVLTDVTKCGGPNPDMKVSIFAVDNTTKLPTTLVYGPVTIPIVAAGWQTALFGNPVMGIGDFAVVAEPGPNTVANMYDPITNPTGNAIAFASDYPVTPTYCTQTAWPCRSGAAVGVFADAPYYFCDPLLQGAGYLKFEWRMRVYKCCAPPKIEATCVVGPDNWPTQGGDFARTSASTMGLGTDVCDIALAWKKTSTKAFMFFNNATAQGGKVFVSDDQAVHCYDLAGGALLWTYFDPSVIKTGGAMRNNITVVGNRVFISGGTAQSFICLDTLGNEKWGRFYDSQGGGTGDMLCAQNRFAVSAVAAMTTTDSIVVVGDELGCFFAFDIKTGLNWPGWSTNPVTFTDGGGIFHSPAYDGSKYFFVATRKGHIYKVDKVDGSFTTLLTEGDGDAFNSGCSYDATEGMIYAASNGVTPKRFKVSSAGVAQWDFAQGNSAYGTPTIGRKKVYFPLDNPATGVLLCAKNNGALEFDFSTVGVGMVSNPATLTCDNYMFVGDRKGQWSLLDVDAKSLVWRRQFYGGGAGIVYGTALIHHSINGKDYAVMTILQDITVGGAFGATFCWDLNATPRPMMNQLVLDEAIGVPLGTGLITGHLLPNVISNYSGCANLNVVSPLPAFNLNPPTAAKITPTITTVSKENARVAEQTAEKTVGTEYLSFFEDTYAAKRATMSGAAQADEEGLFAEVQSRVHFKQAKTQANLAAGANVLRTLNVTLAVPGPIAGGAKVGLKWDYDGTGLERGLDDEYIEIQSNDPDFYPEDPTGLVFGWPYVQVSYVGGCPFEFLHYLYFNQYDGNRREAVSNFGALGDGDVTTEGLDWGVSGLNFSNDFFFDGGLFVIQEGYPNVAADFHAFERRFLPDPSPYAGVCGIDYQDYVPLGRSVVVDWYAGGACPPVLDEDYLDVLGEFTVSSFVDTFEATSQAMGLKISQAEIGAYDFASGYGDFKLIEYKIQNRDAVAKNNLYAGTYIDWDLDADAYYRVPEAGMIAQVDTTAPLKGYGFGTAILPSFTSSVSSDLVDGASYKMMWNIANNYRVYYTTCVECSFVTPANIVNDAGFISFITTYNGAGEDTPLPGNQPFDKSQIFAFPKFNLTASGEHHVYLAIYGVDASSNSRPTITANMKSMAFRINKWAGFARGDVNDDGKVDAIDVAYLAAAVNGSGVPIFPWGDVGLFASNGDVNLSNTTDGADVTYLFNFLMGGAAPQGAWRFTIMP